MIRRPAVAGQFYPGRTAALQQQIHDFLDVIPNNKSLRAFAVISPHAGYIYSGAVAAETFGRVAIPESVVVLGPNHRGAGHPLAVSGADAWSTPLGEVPLDLNLRSELLAACPELIVDDQAHLLEHSLEVQVPFLQDRQPALKILPICIGHVPLQQLLDFGRCLGALLAAKPFPVLIVASSDMTHYESAEAARRKDRAALDKVLQMDPEGLYRVVRDQRISMCGVLPSVVMLEAAKVLGATRAELIRYTNSGEVTGDLSEVVGYAGVVVQ